MDPILRATPVSPWGQATSILKIDKRRCLVHRRNSGAVVIDIIVQLKKARLHETWPSVEPLHTLFCTILLHYLFKVCGLGVSVLHTWFGLRFTMVRGGEVIILLQNTHILLRNSHRGP